MDDLGPFSVCGLFFLSVVQFILPVKCRHCLESQRRKELALRFKCMNFFFSADAHDVKLCVLTNFGWHAGNILSLIKPISARKKKNVAQPWPITSQSAVYAAAFIGFRE